MLRIALIDDDAEHRQTLKNYLNQYSLQEKVSFDILEFADGLNFVEDYQGNIDIAFMDIEMPHMDGLEAARRIRQVDQNMGIVFITNMAQYAIRGYEVNAIDFMVKPVGYFVFTDKLQKALRFSQSKMEREIVVESEECVVKLTLSQIVYIEKEKNYLVYHTQHDTYRVRGTMTALEELLREDGFSKCISSCLVNLRYVTKASKETVWAGGVELPISRQRRKEFKEDLMRYLGGGL